MTTWPVIRVVILLVVFMLVSTRPNDTAIAATVTPAEAGKHIGEDATICGLVASANFASRTRRQPTFLNLDKPYPDHIFTVVIWGESRGAFSAPPENTYRHKRICVTGFIREFRGRPEVIVTGPAQIRVP